MIEHPMIRLGRARSVGPKHRAARIGAILMMLSFSGAWASMAESKAAPSGTVLAPKIGSPVGSANGLWFGLKLQGLPVDPVTAGLNYAEQINRPLDLAFQPATRPQACFCIPSERLRAKVVSDMPVLIPRNGLDRKMVVTPPDSSIDYKMIVKAPDVEAADQRRLGEAGK